jgi:hypothetical protein
VLRSRAPDSERLLALKFVVHLMADVHQPLHAGHGDDRGGNTYQLQAFLQGSNLHAVWDLWLIRALNEDVPTLVTRLDRRLAHTPQPADVFNAAKVAEESCRIVATPGFYPGRLVDVDYLERFLPLLETRLALAGVRLAEVLNRVLPR